MESRSDWCVTDAMMVDEALEQMRTMLDSNEAVQKLIANEAGEGSE